MIDAVFAKELAEKTSVAGSLGLNLKLFIAQLVNFAVVVLVLWRFAWKPLMKVMKERQKRIDEGLENAKRAESELQMAQVNYSKRIEDAEIEAQKIIAASKEKAESAVSSTKLKAKEEISKLSEKARENIAKEKQEMEKEIKERAVEIAFDIAEKVLEEKIDARKEKKFVETIIK